MNNLAVIISGGFSLAYHKVLPDFERLTGIAVTTLSGASQGTGPKTIKHQLEAGADVDVVITPTTATGPSRIGAYQQRGAVATMLLVGMRVPFSEIFNVTGTTRRGRAVGPG